MKPIDKAILHCGTQKAFAARMGVSAMAVIKWRRRQVPAERCLAIETLTGGAVTRFDLRPDVFGKKP